MKQISITNGVDSYTFHDLSQQIPSLVHRGLEGLESPEIRIDRYNNPGTRGATVAQVLPGGRLISLDGVLRAVSGDTDLEKQASYLSERRKLIAATTSRYSDTGRALPLTLKFTDLDDKAYQAEVFAERSLKMAREFPTRGDWQLQLFNPSGVIESQTSTTVTVTLPKDGGVTFDLVWDIVFGDSSGGLATATNAGTTQAKPVIKLYGPMDNPRITNTTTNEYIDINHTMVAGDIITIDMTGDSPTVIQGTNTNRMGKVRDGSVFWSLAPGANTITLTAAGYEADAKAEITWRDAFGGV